MNILLIVGGLVLLILGGNWLLKAAVALSLKLEIPKIVIGMTVVSFATSAPELIVSVNAALEGFPDIAMGNVIGSNIANLGLVLGITVMLTTIDVERSFYKTDWPVMMLASILLYLFVFYDDVLSRVEGVILFTALIAFLVYLLKFQKPAVVDDYAEDDEPLELYKVVLFLVLGGVALWGGSESLIRGAVGMAESFGVSKRVIAITVVSIGTSIPELAASVIAVMKREKAISLGNLIGSNVFNILAVLGITSMVHPITVDKAFSSDLYWMLAFAFVVLPLVFLPKGLRLGWRDGLVLLGSYVFFVYITI
ncbi:calcium/sodium antiporter [Zhouia amylolytica]|uniref:calcium/sodium antiporter n=1 Tax=Zhouia amylolytica TaxID=376730 RepID=UPI0020CC600B|nr:calcium/sodium antiporter [Zhouia amylolytica]MCQ0111176.1 calcium/sodium antiporter [Zhouia amylolytica]